MSDKEFVDSILQMFDVHERIKYYTDKEFANDVRMLIFKYEKTHE